MSPTMTRSEAEDKLLELAREDAKEAAKKSLLAFVMWTMPTYNINWHHVLLAKKLELVAAGKIKRLLVRMPPRHGKTQLVSRHFPAWLLGRDPNTQIIGCSYSADLAQSINRDVQRIMTSDEYRSLFGSLLNDKNVRANQGGWLKNSDIFEIASRDYDGYYIGAGIGGAITGRGMKIGIIDDPIKNRKEANSKTFRKAVWEWYTSTFQTRDEGDAAYVVTLTAWHKDGLDGRIMAHAKETGTHWDVLDLAAIAGKTTIKGDPRKKGGALWPWKMDKKRLAQKEIDVGEQDWASLYQQRPAVAGGTVYRREWWQYFDPDEVPDFEATILTWDTAFKTGEENDFSVCFTIAVTKKGYYVLDRWKDKVRFPELKVQAIALCAEVTPNACVVEDKASGQDLIAELEAETRIPIEPWKPNSDKVARAHAVTGLIKTGRVFLPKGAPWLADFLETMSDFPNAEHDDDPDALNQGLSYLRQNFAIPKQIVVRNTGKGTIIRGVRSTRR